MFPKKTRFYAPILAVVWSLAVQAQTPPAEPKNNTKFISIELTVVSWGRALNDISIIQPEARLNLAIPERHPSTSYRYTASNPIVFERRTTEAGKSPDQSVTITKKVSVPTEWKRALFIVWPHEGGEFDIERVRDNPEEFKAGQVRVINLSDEVMSIKTQLETKVVAPKKQAYFQVASGVGQFDFAYAHVDGTQWKLLGSNAQGITPSTQLTVIIAKSKADSAQETTFGMDSDGGMLSTKLPVSPFEVLTITAPIYP